MKYSIAKGVYDLVPFEPLEEEKWRESHRWQYVEALLRRAAHEYGFSEIRTPLFESTELFVRGVGESSDIVSKEMYTFLDKGERSLTLRPEGTASVMRAIVEKSLFNRPHCHKLFYIGPMFRYERPQAGRYRQHSQFGVEALGIAHPTQDAELIDMACTICNRLGLKNLNIQINTVGDPESRRIYRERLTEFFAPHLSALSEESQARFSKNVLRILDSKNEGDKKLVEQAPKITECLTPEAKKHFETVLEYLQRLNLPYTLNPNLVRGLDYYCHTVFEVTSGQLGAQNAVLGGGRYDGLTATLGGQNLPGIGFAIGLERLIQTMLKENLPFPASPHPKVFFIPLGAAALPVAFSLTAELRHVQIAAEIDLSGKKVQHGFQMANQLNAEYAIVLGEEEIAQKKVKLKKLETREERELSFDQLIPYFLDKQG